MNFWKVINIQPVIYSFILTDLRLNKPLFIKVSVYMSEQVQTTKQSTVVTHFHYIRRRVMVSAETSEMHKPGLLPVKRTLVLKG